MSQASTANANVNAATAAGPKIEIRSSRVWAIFKLRFTKFVFPSHLSADRLGITLVKVESWLTPWIRQDEHLPMSHLAEVTHQRGLIWDAVSIESSGGLNPLSVGGLPKNAARRFVNQVRAWMNV
jgi:hypothetical protein